VRIIFEGQEFGFKDSHHRCNNQEVDIEELKKKIIENFEKNFDANLVYDN